MVEFHLPNDPYFPGQENGGGINAEPEVEPELPLDDDLTEYLPEDLDLEPEVENLPPLAPIPNPNPRPSFQGPTPSWVESLETWSQEQDQPTPFNGD